MTTNKGEMLARHSPTLFLLAGVLLVGYAGLNGMAAFTAATGEPNLFEVGYIAGFLGLIGLYPEVADDQPWLARLGAGAAVAGAVAITAFNVRNLATLAGMMTDGSPNPVFVVMALVGFVLGYLAVGVATLRADVYARSIGLVLLVPGLIVVLMLVHIAAGWNTPESAFVISAGQAMAHLAIGTTLRAEGTAAEEEEEVETEAASDATAKG